MYWHFVILKWLVDFGGISGWGGFYGAARHQLHHRWERRVCPVHYPGDRRCSKWDEMSFLTFLKLQFEHKMLLFVGTRYISDTFSTEKSPLLGNGKKGKESTAMLNEMCIPITEALPSSVSEFNIWHRIQKYAEILKSF